MNVIKISLLVLLVCFCFYMAFPAQADYGMSLDPFERAEIQRLQAEIDRLTSVRDAFIASYGRKRGVDFSRYNFNMETLEFVEITDAQ